MFTRADADADDPADAPDIDDRSYPIAELLSAIVRKADVEALFRKHNTDSFFHIFQVHSSSHIVTTLASGT